MVFSRRDGHDVLALGVVPGRKLLLQASVLGSQGEGVAGLRISFRVASRVLPATPCGAGCYRASTAVSAAPKVVEVDVARSKPTAWRVTMPRPWPPRDASELVARATQTFRGLRTLAVRDWLASGPGRPLFSRWTLVAPDRLTYQIENGSKAVIIGNHRWDKLPGAAWVWVAESSSRSAPMPVPLRVSSSAVQR